MTSTTARHGSRPWLALYDASRATLAARLHATSRIAQRRRRMCPPPEPHPERRTTR
ncbi:hypothetical protein [Catellatospora sp. NPDC049609]|uniref:hypothetical protein n=1 Tax=Catellatospora sp. NPDC049609 TaxID=3155505 RepID=UPI003430390B